MIWRATDPEGNESGKVKYDVVQYTRGTGLDIGCGPYKAFPHFIGVDNKADTALFGIQMEPDNVADASYLPQVPDNRVDFVYSSHLLEHIQDYQEALREWWRIIKVGGYLVLYLPHRDLYPNIGQPGANSDHKHDFIPDDIEVAMNTLAKRGNGGWDLLLSEKRDQDMEYSFLMVFQKRSDWQTLNHTGKPKPEKTVCISRFGGFGDMLQMANLLPELKRQGYHITVNTTPRGMDIVQHDPHIDAFMLQDEDQVPNHELPLFWASQAKRFDKFIQLSESVEGQLLAMPGRANHAWPHAVRHVELNRNYLEWTAQLAELPYQSEAKFYPSDAEQAAASDFLADVRAARNPDLLIGQTGQPVFTILWALSGSSVHKFYPHMDAVIARVMLEMPEAVIFLTGDPLCEVLEQGWELEPRVYKLSGKQTIRETLTLATRVDCVIGPETGVLNAVAFSEQGKVVMLSHSSEKNLTWHWLNTVALTPSASVACYPCHQLHFGRQHCHTEETTGAALCAHDIKPSSVYAALHAHYHAWLRERAAVAEVT